ncbi:Gfo/Idh/MocA family protein [Opitutus terrae]|uniref:Oxidoreductase domain protein n=1 Tax=Opitutus terrae (strain DSM 11246 / JCM 15787 / PB90-1) TaxID=452637 RepID=B1ZVC1_OPITP|nr:Gfo/Idh/MocA family oxidoreductase [Opitutus terrae]ACB76788.1 oxidoreductase domain protein [Opitutus terrae PB90-1]
MSSPTLSRRDFLKAASLASAAVTFPNILRSQNGQSPNNKLNIAFCGVGGRGYDAVNGLKGENMVAFCDVDDERATKAFEEFPNVPRFRDYRQMLDKLGNQIDAVTVSTPDHMHFPIAVAALQLGKHVFVEKPMTHTIAEARKLGQLAREKKVATIMGNQGHANEGLRLIKEWHQAGILGEVREIHSWTDRPIWPQGVGKPDHSKMLPVVPPTLDWDLWLGVAEPREYDPAYMPFNWRGYWDFGTGALGDMGCHIMDGAYWALELTQPTAVEAISARQTEVSPPTASIVAYEFPARGQMPAVKWTWYDGGLQPLLPPEFEETRKLQNNGTLIVGSRATVFADTYYASARIIPETKMRELAPSLPTKTIPRVEGGHFAEWVRACKGGKPAGSNFEYASQLTEAVLLSNVAIRARRRIEWDAATMKITNLPAANQYVSKSYRAGFGV